VLGLGRYHLADHLARRMILKTAVERFKIPFALSPSPGRRVSGILNRTQWVNAEMPLMLRRCSARAAFLRSNCRFQDDALPERAASRTSANGRPNRTITISPTTEDAALVERIGVLAVLADGMGGLAFGRGQPAGGPDPAVRLPGAGLAASGGAGRRPRRGAGGGGCRRRPVRGRSGPARQRRRHGRGHGPAPGPPALALRGR
jgi:hypothetical protein